MKKHTLKNNYQVEFVQAEISLRQIAYRKQRLNNRIVALKQRIQRVFSSIERSNELIVQIGQKLETIRSHQP